jgi:hypothetical protein
LGGSPDAIWRRPPGFYEEAGNWYAILHTRPDVTAHDLTDVPIPPYGAVVLVRWD